MNLLKFFFDFILSLFLISFLAAPFLFLCIVIKLDSPGPIIYWSDRVGINNIIFKMPKLRTMKVGTEVVATHLIRDPSKSLTKIGSFLRSYSLDEIPQLFSVIKGDMSLVGPRPALFNQYDLISQRERKQVNQLKPGITGWAQVNGRDELSISTKVQYDEEYLKRASMSFDIYIISLTIIRAIRKDGISH